MKGRSPVFTIRLRRDLGSLVYVNRFCRLRVSLSPQQTAARVSNEPVVVGLQQTGKVDSRHKS